MRLFPPTLLTEQFCEFQQIEPAAVRMGMLQGAMVEIKTVYIDIDSCFCHWAVPVNIQKKCRTHCSAGQASI